MVELSLNYWALIVAAVANMAIGFLWYGPLFGKQWKKLMGFTDESLKNMPLSATSAMALGAVNSLVIAFMLFYFTAPWVSITLGGAVMGAFWIWLGFVATTQIGSFLWEGKSIKLFFLNVAYSLVAYSVMAVILVLWQG